MSAPGTLDLAGIRARASRRKPFAVGNAEVLALVDEVERLRREVAEARSAIASSARVETILAAVLVSRGDKEDGTRDHLPRVLRDFLSEENGRAGYQGFQDGWAEGHAVAEAEAARLRARVAELEAKHGVD